MVTTVNKQKILDHLFSVLKKRYTVTDPVKRPIIEHVLYAIVREGTTREQADKAFASLQATFVDWNELRVSTVQEICDALGALPDVATRAQRLIGVLQEWFELTYTFDMEEVAKKGLKEGAKKIARLNDANDFTVAWVTLHGFNGHAIPLDQRSINVLQNLGVLDGESESVESLRGTVEHFVPKAKGLAFVEMLSMAADELTFDEKPKNGKFYQIEDCFPEARAESKPRKSR